MDITELIKQKKAMLEAARAKVIDYERQIEALESIGQDDEFDVALAKKANFKNSEQIVATTEVKETSDTLNQPKLPSQAAVTAIQPTLMGRNPKGTVDTVLLEILSDGNERDLALILDELNKRIPNPKSAGSLRGRLMNLKNSGHIESRKRGLFQIATKGENLDSAATNSKNEVFISQPVSGKAH